MTFGSTSLPAATIFNASAFFEKTLSAVGTKVNNDGRVACAPAFLIEATNAVASVLGILNVNSACATQSFSDAVTEPGKQISPPFVGTAELAG